MFVISNSLCCPLFLFVFLTIMRTQAEVYSSVAIITSLMSREQNLIDHLEKVTNLCRQQEGNEIQLEKVDRILVCLKERVRSAAQWSSLAFNPVAGFRLIRRLIRDWSHVTQKIIVQQDKDKMTLNGHLKAMQTVMSQWKVWPRVGDTEGAALSLIILGQVYDLYPIPAWHHHKILTTRACSEAVEDQHTKMVRLECLKLMAADQVTGSKKHSSLNKASDIKKTEVTQKESCEYSYWTLSERDLLFITKVAIKYHLDKEAKVWYQQALASLAIYSEPDSQILIQVQQIGKKLSSRQLHVSSSEKWPPRDVAYTEYLRLCRLFIKTSSERPHSDLGYTCLWHSIFPYIRYKAEVIHLYPDILQFYDVISDREIDHVINMSQDRLTPSSLLINSSSNAWNGRLLRVSQTAWLPDVTDILRALSQRVGYVTGLDITQHTFMTSSEPFQVINYGLGGLYAPHEDSVRKARSFGQEECPSLRDAGDRIATWMFYLTDVAAGGATVFPLLKVFVKPVKGSAVFWYNLRDDGEADTRLVHAACPVIIGNKWVANKWIRERAQMFTRPCSKRAGH